MHGFIKLDEIFFEKEEKRPQKHLTDPKHTRLPVTGQQGILVTVLTTESNSMQWIPGKVETAQHEIMTPRQALTTSVLKSGLFSWLMITWWFMSNASIITGSKTSMCCKRETFCTNTINSLADIFKYISLKAKVWILIHISSSMIAMIQLAICQHWFKVIAWCWTCENSYLTHWPLGDINKV